MLLVDVNVCLHAVRPDFAPEGPGVRQWMVEALNGPQRVALSDVVLSSVVRLSTNRRMFERPLPLPVAVAAVDELRNGPTSLWVSPSSRHWSIFASLLQGKGLGANDVPDAWLAALALDHGATLVTLDRGFARFEGLRTLNPLA